MVFLELLKNERIYLTQIYILKNQLKILNL